MLSQPNHIKVEPGDVLQNHARYDNVGFMWKAENMRTKQVRRWLAPFPIDSRDRCQVGLYPGYIVEQIGVPNPYPDYYKGQVPPAEK